MSASDLSPSGFAVPDNKAPTRLVNQLIVTSRIVVYGFTAFSTNVATQFVQMYDSRELPSSGSVPILTLDCPTNTLRGVSWTPQGRKFEAGIVLVTSSTAGTFTANATADALLDVQFDFLD